MKPCLKNHNKIINPVLAMQKILNNFNFYYNVMELMEFMYIWKMKFDLLIIYNILLVCGDNYVRTIRFKFSRMTKYHLLMEPITKLCLGISLIMK
jgi:hypothetical protein